MGFSTQKLHARGLIGLKELRSYKYVVTGAGQMVLETQQHPGVLKDQVCSPGGATIAGVANLEEHSFRGTVMDAVYQSYKRIQELGK